MRYIIYNMYIRIRLYRVYIHQMHYICICAYISYNIHIIVYTRICIRVYVYIYICIYVHIYTCVCVYPLPISILVNMYAYLLYTYICTAYTSNGYKNIEMGRHFHQRFYPEDHC